MTWITWLADIAIKSSAVLLLALAVNRLLLRTAPAAVRHAVWVLALTSSLAAPALTALLPRWHVPLLRAPAVTASAGTVEPVARYDTPRTGVSNAPVPHAHQASSPAAPGIDARATEREPRHTGQPRRTAAAEPRPAIDVQAAAQASPAPAARPTRPAWSMLAFILWMAAAGLLLVRQAIASLRAARLSRRARIPGRAPWMSMARSLARSMGAPAGTRFLRSDAIRMPIACGILRPTVVLPAEADTWPDERVRVVLLHELAHVRRRDCLAQAVADAACAVFWFNPLAWMAARELRRERERACDDLVLAAGLPGPDYAGHLLAIARSMRGAALDAVFSNGVAMAHRSELEGRLMAILDDARPRRALTLRGFALASTFSMALVVPLAAMNPWVQDEIDNDGQAAAPSPVITAAEPQDAPVASGTGAGSGSGAGRGRGTGHGQSGASSVAPAVAASVSKGVASGVASGVSDGIAGGISAGVAGGISDGVANGIARGVIGGVAAEFVSPGVMTAWARGLAPAFAGAWAQGPQPGRPGPPPPQPAQPGQPAPPPPPAGPGPARADRPVDPKVVAALAEALKDSDAEVRQAAMATLAQLRDPATFDAMVGALKDKDDDVRQQAAFALGQMRDKRAVAPLTAALADANPEVRQQAVFGLGQIRDISTLDALTGAIKDSDAEVRQQAAFALSQLRDARAVPALMIALQDKDGEVRQQAAFALSQIRDPKAVDGLLVAIKDSNAEVRQQALFALGQIGDARATDAAMAALKDPDPEVRQMAAHALGQLLRKPE